MQGTLFPRTFKNSPTWSHWLGNGKQLWSTLQPIRVIEVDFKDHRFCIHADLNQSTDGLHQNFPIQSGVAVLFKVGVKLFLYFRHGLKIIFTNPFSNKLWMSPPQPLFHLFLVFSNAIQYFFNWPFASLFFSIFVNSIQFFENNFL